MGNDTKQNLELLTSNPKDRKALNRLISTCFSIARTYLNIKYFSKNDSKLKWVESIDDLAMDSIVPLFIVNGNGKLGILSALDNWNSSLEDEADTLFFLNRVVWKRVEQTVVKLIKTKDPIFGKIHKNISTCVATNPFKKINYLGKTLIVRDDFIEVTGLIITESEFENLPAHLFSKKQFKLCDGILNYIETETDYFPAIPMNALVRRIKSLYFASKIQQNPEKAIDTVPNYIDDIFNISMEKIKDKLFKHYLGSKKLNENECNLILKTFATISEEMKNGGLNNSLYEYMHLNAPSLTKKEFYDNYHGIVNYLLGELKRQIYLLIEEK